MKIETKEKILYDSILMWFLEQTNLVYDNRYYNTRSSGEVEKCLENVLRILSGVLEISMCWLECGLYMYILLSKMVELWIYEFQSI